MIQIIHIPKGLIFLFLSIMAIHSETSDSIHFYNRISAITELEFLSADDSFLIETAQELAQDKFWEDALDLIEEINPTATEKTKGSTDIISSTSSVSDSLEYVILRDSIRLKKDTSDQYEIAIASSEGLAAERFFGEAAEILSDYLSLTPAAVRKKTSDSLLDNSNSQHTSQASKIKWRLQSGADYYNYEDYDSAYIIDSIQFEDFSETGKDATGYISAQMTASPDNKIIKELQTKISLYNYKAKGYGALKTSFLHNTILFSAEFAAQKRIDQEYKDSSDNTEGDLELTLSTPSVRFPLQFSIPIDFDFEKYRHNRVGYSDNYHVEVEPTLMFVPHNSFTTVSFSMLGGREVYDSPDRNNSNSHIEGILAYNGFIKTLIISAELRGDKKFYPYATGSFLPRHERIAELYLDVVISPVSWLSLSTNVQAAHTNASFIDSFTVDTIVTDYTNNAAERVLQQYGISPYSFSLAWPECNITATVLWTPVSFFECKPSFNYSSKHIPAVHDIDGLTVESGPILVDDWFDSYTPSITLSLKGKKISADFSGTIAWNDIKEIYRISQDSALAFDETVNLSDDNRTYGGSVMIQWEPKEWLYIFGSFDYEYFDYTDKEEKYAQNVSASLSATITIR